MPEKNEKEQPVFLKRFGQVEEPLLDRRKKHEIIVILVYAESKETSRRAFLKLPNDIPSHDTFGRVFSLLHAQAFQEAFREWMGIIQGKIKGIVAEKGHGRIEKRQYWYTRDVEGLGTLERWPHLNGMVLCRATRTEKGETTVEDRYFITSAAHDDVAKIADAVRATGTWRMGCTGYSTWPSARTSRAYVPATPPRTSPPYAKSPTTPSSNAPPEREASKTNASRLASTTAS